jgi:hypothetical protein
MNVVVNSGPITDLTLVELNARFMTHETFTALVRNIRHDGVLTQLPFVIHDPDTDRRTVLSGNHRVKAAAEAGLTDISWLETSDPLTHQQQVAIQLSHNAIVGTDDPAILVALYEQLDELDWREYSGLDDATLDLLAEVTIDGLSEPNLDYQSLYLVFLPDELTRAKAAFTDASELAEADETWLCRYQDHARLLDAISVVGQARNIFNRTTAVGAVLDVYEAHRTDLMDAYMDTADTDGKNQWVPLVTVLGNDLVPAPTAALLHKAVEKLMAEGADTPWQALSELCRRCLAAVPAADGR